MAERFLEIDALRGLAVCGMVIFHFLFDYSFFVSPGSVDVNTGILFWMGRATAVVFVALAGLSLTLHAHRKESAANRMHEWRRFVQRGIIILSLGLIISLATFVFFPEYSIWFGVLHLLGVSFIFGIPFLHRKRAALVGGIIFSAGGILLSTIFKSTLPFWPILLPVTFSTFDYFPLLPWFGVFLLGVAAGHYFYPHGIPREKLGWKNGNIVVRTLSVLGKKSLLIYFIHQPVLIGLLLLIQKIVN
jgi:uncharacterized membrane protein